MNDTRLGEILAEAGTITRRQLEQALAYQKEHGGLRIGQALTALGFATQRQVLQALARRLDLPLADLSQQTAEREALELVPQALAVRYHVLPLRCRGGVLSLAADDPLNYYAFEDLRQLTGLELDIQLAEPEPLLKAVQYYYADLGARRAVRTADVQPGGGVVPPPGPAAVDVRAAEDGAPAVRLLNNLLQRAITAGASDIHLEPFEDRTGVRMRIDGALIEYMQLPRTLHQPLIARIKILAGLDIAEHRLPQDGHFRAHSEEGGGVNLRVSVMPTVFGEKAVLRLLADSAAIDHAGHFGMRDAVYARFAPLLQRPNGIIYLTGPTGSGKTTTLYLILEALRRRSVNIVTIEDPVERNIDRISQTQINPVAGLTFESGLRALLRQDPDIIMVGETRDAETAAISVRAAITGHMVFSTLHTNDALGSVARLADMGVEPYMAANALAGLVAQRLLRKVCPHCGQEEPLTPEEAALLGPQVRAVRRGRGCPHCHGTGYRGRVAIHELVAVDKTLRRLISERAPAEQMAAHARQAQGMRTLREEALDLVREGVTTPEEALKILFEE